MKNKNLLYIVFFLIITASLHSQDNFRWNLINALGRGNYQEVESLLQSNINTLSAQDKRMVMSFVLTYSRGDTALQAINMLASHGITPNSYDLFTALNMNQSDEIIRLILEQGAAPNGEILLVVMSKQRFDFASQFINAGVDVNYSYPLARNYSDGMTPLLYAAKFNNLDLVRQLLERGANINARNREGDTALSLAHANGNMQIYNMLMERGAAQIMPPPAQQTSGSSNTGGSAGSSGIASVLNSRVNFQRGTYRLSGGDLSIRFIGTEAAGSINYTINGRPGSGAYRTDGSILTVTMENRSFIYRLDSGTAFSGNGESWVRIGD